VKKQLLRILGPLVGLLLFLLALAVLRRELRGERVHDILRELTAIPSHQLALAVLLTGLSFLALTGYDAVSLRYVRKRLPIQRIALTSFITYAFSQALGFPLLTGGSVRFRLYSAWGLSAIQITNVVAFASFTFWLGVLTVGGLIFLNAPPEMVASFPLSATTVREIGVLALLVVAGYVWWTIGGRRIIRVREWRFTRPSPTLALRQLALACVDWTLAGSVLYALLPQAAQVTFPAFLGIFLVAFVAGIVSHVPGGLGVFETVLLLLLSGRVEESAMVGTLIAYRAIYNLLPLGVAATLLGVHEASRRRAPLARVARAFGRWVPALVPNVLALTTFVGGTILLISGATPAARGRMHWLADLLPLPVIEASHFLASIAGIGLVLLARGLQRRLDAAYHLTVLLLGAGIVFSLLKGLDYEEAMTLAIMLGALLPSRRHFHRRASLLGEPFTPGWTLAILMVLAGSIWLGTFSFRNIDYMSDVWWRFARDHDAPRFLRASVGVTVVVLVLAVRRLLRPMAPEPVTPTSLDLERAAVVAARSPDTMAYLALLGDKTLLFGPTSSAFLMYGVAGRSWVALGDPVGAREEREELAWRFLEMCDRHDAWPAFYLVSAEHLPLYVDLGLTLLKVGEEAHVDLTAFRLEGRGHKSLRRTVHAVEREGCTFDLVPAVEVARHLTELRRVSDAWLAHKHTREKSFSLGAFHDDYIARFPAALVRQGDRIVAFANVWLGADQRELSVDLMRYTSSAPAGVMDFLFAQLMLWGKREGYRWFNLGMAPLSGLETRTAAPVWNRMGALVFRLGDHFYNFQGIRMYKEKFDPEWHPRYIASRGGLMLPRVLTNIATLISGGVKGVVAK
jgi:phosphatidylglycerol lysyltransferase